MKAIIVLLIVGVVALLAMYLFSSSIEESFDPTQQGRETRAAINVGASWTEVLEVAGAPRYWRGDTSNFDFVYTTRFDEGTGELIRQQLEQNALPYGFSFLYKFSDAVTFAVNFDRHGKATNIQDKEGKADLMDAAGG